MKEGTAMKNIHDNPDLYNYDLNNAGSTTDCTGLIPAPPQSEEEQQSYEAIYHYAIPQIDKKQP